MKPRLLDLFCGAGGASRGYAEAGFEVVGVDIEPQPRYPYEFHHGDALSVLRWMARYPMFNGETMWRPGYFAAVHASPPCQAYSVATQSQRNAGKEYPDLLAPTRDLLTAVALPWVIENVPGAPMRADLRLCGCQFGLDLRRERWFETSWRGFGLRPPCHHPYPVPSVVGKGTPSRVRQQLGYNPTIADCRRVMGIHWMTRKELSQAIPPAYTRWVGEQLLAHIDTRSVAHAAV